MESAREALDAAIRSLFLRRVLKREAGADNAVHPLCECDAYQMRLGDEWIPLRRFPVLKRYVVMQWRKQLDERLKSTTVTKRLKRKLSHDRIVGIYRSLVMVLLRCGILAYEHYAQTTELIELLVTAAPSLQALGEVIALNEKTESKFTNGLEVLPLRVRLLLLSIVLRGNTVCERIAVNDVQVLEWVEAICSKMQEELLEAMAVVVEPKKQSQRQINQSIGARSHGEHLCGFCRLCGVNGVKHEEDADTGIDLSSAAPAWLDNVLRLALNAVTKLLGIFPDRSERNTAKMVLGSFRHELMGLQSKESHRSQLHTSRSLYHSGRGAVLALQVNQSCIPRISMTQYERSCQTMLQSWTETQVTREGSISSHQLDLWKKIWRKEVMLSAVTYECAILSDIIAHCSIADDLTLVSMGMQHKDTASMQPVDLPGFRLLRDVIQSNGVDYYRGTVSFANTWHHRKRNLHSKQLGQMDGKVGIGICRLYLEELLMNPGCYWVVHSETESSDARLLRDDQLVVVVHLIFSFFSDGLSSELNRRYCDKWDFLLMRSKNNFVLQYSNAHDGMNWLQSLRTCAQELADNKFGDAHRDPFSTSFRTYSQIIIYNIVASNGGTIFSGGSIRRKLCSREEDLITIQQMINGIMIAFGMEWVSGLISRTLRRQTLDSVCACLEDQLDHEQGLRNLLFPALQWYLWTTVSLKGKSMMSLETLFYMVVQQVNTQLKGYANRNIYVYLLVRFCHEWDLFHQRQVENSSGQPSTWGQQALLKADMLPDILRYYEIDDALHQEKSKTLKYLSQVLHAAVDCPSALEGRLFHLLSRIKSLMDNVDGDDLWKTPSEERRVLITHSKSIVSRLLHATASMKMGKVQRIMAQLKKENPDNIYRIQQDLKRWTSYLELNDKVCFGRESRLEFALLCNRLIYWFPADFTELKLLVNPLDYQIVQAVNIFIKNDQGIHSTSVARSSFLGLATTSSSSTIRVEMLLRTTISTSVLPNLIELSAFLAESILGCGSQESIDALANMMRRVSSMLMIEVVADSFGSVLCTELDFIKNADFASYQNHKVVSSSVESIRVSNVFKMIAISRSIFGLSGIAWSKSLFNETAVGAWIPYFYDYLHGTRLCRDHQLVNSFLECLEEGLSQANNHIAPAMAHSYWLIAFLCTLQIPHATCVSSSIRRRYERLERITAKILSLCSLSKNGEYNEEIMSDHRNKVLLVWLDPTMVATAHVHDDRLLWSDTSCVERNDSSATLLHLRQKRYRAMDIPRSRLYLPFSMWFPSSLVYSQVFLPWCNASDRISSEKLLRRFNNWEQSFACCLTYFYLPIEFGDSVTQLLIDWVLIWISSNLARVIAGKSMLILLPFQQSLFRRLCSTQKNNPATLASRVTNDIWTLVFYCIHRALDNYADTPQSRIAVIDVISNVMNTLELVAVTAPSSFNGNNPPPLEELLDELGKLLSRQELSGWSLRQVFHLIRYPLELVLFHYVTRTEYKLETSKSHGLSLDILRSKLHLMVDKVTEPTTDANLTTTSNKPNGDISAIRTFKSWAMDMQLKYEYIDARRCSDFLGIIVASFSLP